MVALEYKGIIEAIDHRRPSSKILDKGRPLIISSTAVNVAIRELKKTFGTGLDAFAYMTGEEYSKALLDGKRQSNLHDRTRTVSRLIGLAEQYGWGVFKITPISHEEKLTVTVSYNIFHGIEGGCYFLKGLIKGIIDGLFPTRRPYTITESIHSPAECVFELEAKQQSY